MKSRLLNTINLSIVTILILFASCSRSINGLQTVHEKKSKNIETIISDSFHQTTPEKNKEEILTADAENSIVAFKDELIPSIGNKNSEKFELDWSGNNLIECDVIILKSGVEISAKVLEISPTEIKYKKCENLEGPTYGILKGDVFMIKYSNGSKEIMASENIPPQNNSQAPANNNSNQNDNSSNEPVTHWAAIVGMICSLVGLFLFGLVLGLAGIIFSAIALSAIKKNPEKYKGKGMAITGLVAGGIGLVLWIWILSYLLWF